MFVKMYQLILNWYKLLFFYIQLVLGRGGGYKRYCCQGATLFIFPKATKCLNQALVAANCSSSNKRHAACTDAGGIIYTFVFIKCVYKY